MQTSKEIFSNERRVIASKGVYVQIADIGKDHSYFLIYDPKDITIKKYMGKINEANDHSQYCICPDNFHRNTEDYKRTHPYGFQCKHQIAYREYLSKFRESFKAMEEDLVN